MLLVLINILIVIVVGAILFYLIDRFVRDGRLANLLKILVALICLVAILQRLLPLLGVGGIDKDGARTGVNAGIGDDRDRDPRCTSGPRTRALRSCRGANRAFELTWTPAHRWYSLRRQRACLRSIYAAETPLSGSGNRRHVHCSNQNSRLVRRCLFHAALNTYKYDIFYTYKRHQILTCALRNRRY